MVSIEELQFEAAKDDLLEQCYRLAERVRQLDNHSVFTDYGPRGNAVFAGVAKALDALGEGYKRLRYL